MDLDVKDDLFRKDSKAYHLALQELAEVLKRIGFVVRKKTARESTLRVYPIKFQQYPLLNPRFQLIPDDLDSVEDTECLDFTVLSQGGDGGLDRYLQAFSSTSDCAFIPNEGFVQIYHYHGNYVLPLTFIGAPGSQKIDFPALEKPLRRVLQFLQGCPC